MLEGKKGVFVFICHNEIRDELVDLASKAFSPSAVRDEPKIHSSRANEQETPEGRQDQPVKRLFRNNRNEDRGDVLIRGLWSKGTDCILDVRMTDLDAKSNKSRNPDKVLAAHEQEQIRSIWSLASNNDDIFLPSWYQRMASSAKKRR